MKCEKCKKNEATVFYREVINGKENSYKLCGSCAAEKEQEHSMFFPSMFGGDVLGSLFSPVYKKAPLQGGGVKCPLCGSEFGELVKNGRVSCPECYKAFESELAPTLKRLHGGALHRGRVPGKLSAELNYKREEKQLQSKLKEAVANEEYEKAAEYRDKLRQLREGR